MTLSEEQRELADLPAAAKALREASQDCADDEGKTVADLLESDLPA